LSDAYANGYGNGDDDGHADVYGYGYADGTGMDRGAWQSEPVQQFHGYGERKPGRGVRLGELRHSV
jgi:hypothetical protein